MREFVPMTDELLYDRERLPAGPLVPYRCGLPCRHELQTDARGAGTEAAPAPEQDGAVSASP